ncbi:hypothetical protein GLOTRDRAFT_118074 [Gloeophyllum trabeum ATCC 11539]|uniref:Xylanolytic transcriptional activator regulatory domain-containing protein n=1 Tax=Gloeophyllum trabeum (strain ATCC 11539 / FP-39264 / Madison 617) TaxID=670483 RepID=S7PUG4_GLOTA|nr:uncharacterized protein GLOTRDRAFT_118074 [Gloeophyllum trabeum ATCC 11539]EPQ50998.1 hypothetical protein GLOTRDRAFT_118074 [Gloeophyllum trabeum ATCC 11539]
MQNQIHELAKTLPPPRKQNTACDACRCAVPHDESKVQSLARTRQGSHYSQQATSEKKRSTGGQRRPRAISTSHSSGSPSNLPTPSPFQAFNAVVNTHTPTRQLLAYLFSPPLENATVPSYVDWGELAPNLEDESFRLEFALDLVEVFFQIVHTRIPLLNPTQFRTRFKQSLTVQHSSPIYQDKPLHPALVATVIAWGAKFSEHPLLVADRRRNANGQSHLAQALINRARELAESMKVYRMASADNVVISLLIEPLQAQSPDDPNGFHRFWLISAIRLLLDLQINHKSVMSNIEDPEARGTMIFAWWMALLSDAFGSAYYRRKPMLDDDDYDIDFYTAEPVPAGPSDTMTPSPREQYEFLGYYRASHALARISRQMSRQLWRPATESDGIPFEVLCNFVQLLSEWRDQYLTKVGVPSNFQATWDFVSAVSACGSDATYHVMWIILFNALDDFGIKEVNDNARLGNPAPNHAQIERVKAKVMEEALHGSLRISGLAGVLTSNGYLRLDPAVMHVSCIQAGTLLARLGRPEVQNCIAGLEQYSAAYAEAADHAAEMKRHYAAARAGESDFGHMSTVVPRLVGMEAGQAMNVDQAQFSNNGANNPMQYL